MKIILVGCLMSIVSFGKDAYSFDVQGHRGARGLFPENTLPAFAAAIEAGTPTLELDLHVTEDEEIVIYHDFVLDCASISSAPTFIRSLKLSEIKTIDCGSTIDPDFPRQKKIPGTQIPTLDELFSMINKTAHPHAKKVRLNLEVKRDPRHPEFTLSAEELALKIVSKVKNSGFAKRVYYSSFDPEVLMKIHQLDPQAELGFIFDETSLSMLKQLNQKHPMESLVELVHSFQAKIVSPEEVLLDASLVHSLQQSGFHVVPWTVNSPKRWTELIEMGVDGLITDYPHDLLAFLAQVEEP